VGARNPLTDEARPVLTSARYRRALRCGVGTPPPDQMFRPDAPVRIASTASRGKNSGSVKRGAW
jgi:hypothetical protein